MPRAERGLRSAIGPSDDGAAPEPERSDTNDVRRNRSVGSMTPLTGEVTHTSGVVRQRPCSSASSEHGILATQTQR